ncbi:MAG: hypothetical protein KJP07_13600 [Desulfatitalea sp.]|nr:hypothetical protein [Desulfatitalea sp.]
MASSVTGKTIILMLEDAVKTFEEQDTLLPMVDFYEPKAADMQNSGNFIWRPVEQQAPIIEGWDVTGNETGIIEETYPALLGTPKNDLVKLRADDVRDQQFHIRRAARSMKRQASSLNSNIAQAIATQGALFYKSTATSGFPFISEAQVLMNQRQLNKDNGRYFLLNDADGGTFAEDLAARQTVQGRPEQAWKTGQIAQNVAEFDVYTGSFLPNLVGGADPATTVTGDQSFAPTSGSVNATTGVVTPTDYRSATIPVAASAGYNVGDKVTISNAGTTVKAVGLDDKTVTTSPMTFTVISKPSATSLEIFPKPIALDDAALSTLEKAYANIDTVILNAATVDRLNTDATNQTNLFWEKGAIEVVGGTIPDNLFSDWGGMKTVSQSLSNGLKIYMMYDGDILSATFTWRMFVWYGISVKQPQNCGVALL